MTGTTLYYNPQGSNSGTFTVGATSSDPESGSASVAFPNVFGSDGATDSSARTRTTTHGAPPTPPAAPRPSQSRTAPATTSSGTFTVTPDTTAPTGQSVSLSGGPWYATDSVDLTLANGSDSGAGVDNASGVVERDSATLAGSTCGSFSGAWTTVTLVGGADTTVTSGHCYRYRYSVSDRSATSVAPSAASADAKIDSTAPAVAATPRPRSQGRAASTTPRRHPLVPAERFRLVHPERDRKRRAVRDRRRRFPGCLGCFRLERLDRWD